MAECRRTEEIDWAFMCAGKIEGGNSLIFCLCAMNRMSVELWPFKNSWMDGDRAIASIVSKHPKFHISIFHPRSHLYFYWHAKQTDRSNLPNNQQLREQTHYTLPKFKSCIKLYSLLETCQAQNLIKIDDNSQSFSINDKFTILKAVCFGKLFVSICNRAMAKVFVLPTN